MMVLEDKPEDHQSYYNSTGEEHEYLYQISMQSIQQFLRYFSLN